MGIIWQIFLAVAIFLLLVATAYAVCEMIDDRKERKRKAKAEKAEQFLLQVENSYDELKELPDLLMRLTMSEILGGPRIKHTSFVAEEMLEQERRRAIREKNEEKCHGCLYYKDFQDMGSHTYICNRIDDLTEAAKKPSNSATCENKVTYEDMEAYLKERKAREGAE